MLRNLHGIIIYKHENVHALNFCCSNHVQYLIIRCNKLLGIYNHDNKHSACILLLLSGTNGGESLYVDK